MYAWDGAVGMIWYFGVGYPPSYTMVFISLYLNVGYVLWNFGYS